MRVLRHWWLTVVTAMAAGACTGAIGDSPGSGADEVTDPDAGEVADPVPDADVQPLDFDPSNFGPELLTASTAVVALTAADSPVRIDTDTGTIVSAAGASLADGVVFTPVAQTDAPAIGVFSVGALTVEPGAVIEIRGTNAFAIASAGDVTIDGEIVATGGLDDSELKAGPGGFDGADGEGGNVDGGGPGGGLFSDNNDTGAGGAGHVALGGNGGDRGGAPGGAGGPLYGTPELVPLIGGSGGANGPGGNVAAGNGDGGGGGGAVQISARGALLVGGGINVSGAGGQGGDLDDGGGGGGSGGAVLLEARLVTVTGTLAANGGGGGAGAEDDNPGASGAIGSLSDAPALGGTGIDDGSSGGAGGAGAVEAGQPGTNTGGNDNGDDNAGGGGGAGGRIFVRSRGAAQLTGTLSPSAGFAQAAL